MRTAMRALNMALTAVLLAVVVREYRMTRQSRRNVRAEGETDFRQSELLMALYAELKPAHALPRTRGWAASPDFLLNLVRHVFASQPRNIVECGSGSSTVVLAECMQKRARGHVYSLEHDAVHASLTRQMLRDRGLQDFATVIDAPLTPFSAGDWQGMWYRLSGLNIEGGIDMLVVDGPPNLDPSTPLARYPAVPALRDQLNAGAAIFADDADRPGERAMVARWLQENPAMRRRDVSACEKGCALLVL